MALKTEKMIKDCLKAIEKHNLLFIEDIISYVPFSKNTFYTHKLHENDDIKKALDFHRVSMKVGLRKKWYASDNPTVQIALYKLIATESEYERLSGSKEDDRGKKVTINVSTKEED